MYTKKICIVSAAIVMLFSMSPLIHAADCGANGGNCGSNKESETYACTLYDACSEKVVNDSWKCGAGYFWSGDDCTIGSDSNRGGPLYTPVSFPNLAETNGGAWRCQVQVEGQTVWKFFATSVNGTCTWQESQLCECNNSSQGSPVGNATECNCDSGC